jgi:hypothetical protein
LLLLVSHFCCLSVTCGCEHGEHHRYRHQCEQKDRSSHDEPLIKGEATSPTVVFGGTRSLPRQARNAPRVSLHRRNTSSEVWWTAGGVYMGLVALSYGPLGHFFYGPLGHLYGPLGPPLWSEPRTVREAKDPLTGRSSRFRYLFRLGCSRSNWMAEMAAWVRSETPSFAMI